MNVNLFSLTVREKYRVQRRIFEPKGKKHKRRMVKTEK
jgi:hypothetical protein